MWSSDCVVLSLTLSPAVFPEQPPQTPPTSSESESLATYDDWPAPVAAPPTSSTHHTIPPPPPVRTCLTHGPSHDVSCDLRRGQMLGGRRPTRCPASLEEWP